MIAAVICTVLALAGTAGCASHQRSQNVAPAHGSDPSRSIANTHADSTIGNPHITVVDLSKKFLAFFDSASRTPLDRDARWAMWQRLYGFAARPPGPFGDTIARRLFEGAWDRYPAALPRIRQGAEGFGFAPDSVLRQIVDLLGCGGDTHVRLIAFVGGFEANAFAFPGPDGTQTIAIPVEAGDALGALVHELTHAVHHSKTCANITSGYEMTLPELVLSEGLAMRVTERLIPGYPSIHYIAGSQAWLDTADSRRAAILGGVQQHISDVGGATAQRFTFGNGTTGLGREGYYAGWVITGALLDSGVSLHQMATTPSSQLPALITRGIIWEERGRSVHAGSLATQGSAQLDVRLESDEADAAVAILNERTHGDRPTEADWHRLFSSRGYQHLKEREAGMGRAFTDSAFAAFLTSDTLLKRAPSLDRAVPALKRLDVAAAAGRSLKYLPPGTPLRARLYLEVKPATNSFVFTGRDSTPSIFLYVNPDRSPAQLENTVAHELHHIGLNKACPEPALSRATPAQRMLLLFLGAFGEGQAMLAAAGSPSVNPHATDDDTVQARWDRDVAHATADIEELSRFFRSVLDGSVTSADSVEQQASTYFGVQGPWYTVGWLMASTIEKELGRDVLVRSLCEPTQFIALYNNAARRANARGVTLPMWHPDLVTRLASLRVASD